ncbi:MAG: histidine phosphatase family protein [Bryobacteraceae bacterium]|nr:histidine phosphatase family protein [Bryobacteraceae bacterium]
MEYLATLLLVRHAHTDCRNNGHSLLCGRHDAPLSALGWRQVETLRGALKNGVPVDAVYTSPLRRAMATATAAPPRLLPHARALRSLAEINCGLVDGMPLARLKVDYPELWQRNWAQDDPSFRWPGGESYEQMRRRVLRAARCLGSRHLGQRILLFTHAGFVNQLLGAVAGQSPARWDNFRPANASITELRFDGRRFEVVRFDDRSHLPAASICPPSE